MFLMRHSTGTTQHSYMHSSLEILKNESWYKYGHFLNIVSIDNPHNIHI